MVDDVHLQDDLLSSDEVRRGIQRQGKIFGHAQLWITQRKLVQKAALADIVIIGHQKSRNGAPSTRVLWG